MNPKVTRSSLHHFFIRAVAVPQQCESISPCSSADMITYGNKFTDRSPISMALCLQQCCKAQAASQLCPDSLRGRRAGWTRAAGRGDPPSCAARCGWRGWTPAGNAPGASAAAAPSATRSTRPAACWKSSAAATPHPALTAQRQNSNCCVPLPYIISSYGLSFLRVSFPTATYTHPAPCLYRLCKN